MSKEICIGIDLGGTKIAFGLVDKKGKLIEEIVIPTHPSKDYEVVFKEIVDTLKILLKKTKQPIKGMGIGIAGQIDPIGNQVIFAPNLFWHQVPLQKDLQNEFKDFPILLVNDVRAATFGEWKFGAGKDCKDLICLFIGTGIGSGIISHGQLLQGSSNTAGECGHIPINFNGRKCNCGASGCFEAYAGGWAIAKRAKDLIEEDPNLGKMIKNLAKGNPISAKHVVEAFYEGDPLSKLIIDEVTEALILGTTSLVHTLNPEKIIFAGGIILGLPDLIDWVEEGVKRRALKAAVANLKFIPSSLKENAGIIGAASLMFD